MALSAPQYGSLRTGGQPRPVDRARRVGVVHRLVTIRQTGSALHARPDVGVVQQGQGVPADELGGLEGLS